MHHDRVDEPQLWSVWLFALLGAVALISGLSFAYVHYGDSFVFGLENELAETHLRAAQRLYDAGELEEAADKYRAALDKAFRDPKDKAHTLKALGRLLWVLGKNDEAQALLARALAHPLHDLNVFPPFVELLHQEQDEAGMRRLAEQWLAEARSAQDITHQANAHYWLGVAEVNAGDLGAAESNFKAGLALDPNGLNAYGLGRFYYEMFRFDEAKPLLEAYATHAVGRIEFAATEKGDTVTYTRRAEARDMLSDIPVFPATSSN